MPRVAADPSTYLDALTKAREAAKPGAVVSAQVLARTTGITWRVLERWIDEDPSVPVISRGAVGAKWEFDLVAVLDHLIKRARSITKTKRARREKVTRLAGFGPTDPAPADPSPPPASDAMDRGNDIRNIKLLAEAQMLTHRLKQQQGQYIPADAVAAAFADMMTTMQTETLATTAKLDPAGIWPPEIRLAVEDDLRTMLITVRDKLDAAARGWGGGATA
jgi:phage terminase Nu1 subunit (DNA packaging protein)